MKAAYFTIGTTGPQHDVDRMDEMSGIVYDHSQGIVINTFHYQVVADMHMVNGAPVEAYRAADLMQSWLSDDCYYMTVNADKAKHFIRSFLFSQYINPFEHERSGRQNKLLDVMMLIRASHHMGECPVELPVSPVGEVRYEMDILREMNYPRTTLPEAMANVVSGIIGRGGKPFLWVKSQDEKKKLLSSLHPVVHLGLIDKEVEVSPRILIPFASSDTNSNRFYVYEPSESIRTPEQAISAHMAFIERGERGMTKDMQGRGISYLDANKSDLIVGLNEVPSRYRLNYLSYELPRRAKQSLDRITSLISQMTSIEESYQHGNSGSFYEASFRRGDVNKWSAVRSRLLDGDVDQARKALGKTAGSNVEKKRMKKFMEDNNINHDPTPFHSPSIN